MEKLNDIVMFACNQGGHFSQMLVLKDLFGQYKSVLVTDNIHAKKDQTPALAMIDSVEYAMSIARNRNTITRENTNKSRLHSIKSYIALFAECRLLWKKYRPTVIITTGSNIAVGLFIYGKIRGSKLIFIETRAKVYSKTVTGKIVGRIADQIYVQWPEMLSVYPNAKYFGTLV